MIDWTRYPLNEKPKYRALQRLIEALIQQGLLLAGEQLPAERQLAIQSGLNRSTVARAFDELASAGFLERQVGRGTYISQAALTQMTHKRVNWHTYLTTQRRPKGQRIRQQYQALIQQAPAGLIDGFSSDLPTELVPAFQLPALRWTDFVKAQELERPNGYQPLLAAVQQHYSSTLTVSQLLITAGAQQSLLLVLQGLLIPGEAVAIEQPSFFYDAAIFEVAGVRTYSAPCDAEGMLPAELERLIKQHRLKLVILNPNYQNPTGQVMGLKRRQALLALCQQYQIPIVEDDVFGWLHFEQRPLPTLKELDPENVIYISSLSKIMGSSTRIGWLAATPQVIQQLAQIQAEMDVVPSIMAQQMVTLAMAEPQFKSQLQRLTRLLKARAQATYEALTTAFPEWQIEQPRGGYYLWVQYGEHPRPLTDFINERVMVAPGILFGSSIGTFRLNFARLDHVALTQLVERLRLIFDI